MSVSHNLPDGIFKTIAFARILRLANIADKGFVPLGRKVVLYWI